MRYMKRVPLLTDEDKRLKQETCAVGTKSIAILFILFSVLTKHFKQIQQIQKYNINKVLHEIVLLTL